MDALRQRLERFERRHFYWTALYTILLGVLTTLLLLAQHKVTGILYEGF